MITLNILSRSGRPIVKNGVRLSEEATVGELQEAIYRAMNKQGKFSPVRQRLTLPPALGERSGKALLPDKSLSFYDLKDGSEIQYKDLGLQIGYAVVFFWEYFGPLVIYPYFWVSTGRMAVYGTTKPTTVTQDMALLYWSFHYAKRIWETANVHHFSHATMPIANLVRNCGYYWIFAAFVSYFINHPDFTDPPLAQTVVCLGLAYLCQAGNFASHLTLRSLRSDGKTGYQIPSGHLFNYVTCANYTFEIWGWILFTIATQSLPALIFAACGAFQMVQWALAKHKRLRKLFDGKDGRDKYPRRWVILPPLL